MTPSEYVKEAKRTDAADYLPIVDRMLVNFDGKENTMRLLHMGIGMSGEAGEIIDSLKKHVIYGKELDKVNLVEECGDVLWYMANMLDELGVSFEEVMAQNAAKLQKRYPKGFTEADAIARADKELMVTLPMGQVESMDWVLF